MALAMETDLLPVAALACADAYAALGSSVIIKDEPFVTVFSDGDIAEVILDHEAQIEPAIPYIAGLADVWKVVVVLPAALGGAGHRLLRGRFDDVRLQLWWADEAVIRFGQVEIP